MSSAMHEECGVFGIYAPGKDVARMTGFGLQALQHRGQESAGIAVGDGETVNVSKDLGLVTQVFDDDSLNVLVGDVAIGHVRYSTSGSKASWEAAQPHMSAMGEVLLALAHNGTLTNTNKLRARLIADGARLYSSTDSEVAAKLIGMYTERTNHLREGIRHAMELMEGAYAMVLCTADGLYAFRDPHGIRPLCIGKLPDDAGWVISSETCGLDIVGATYVRDIEPGEVVRVNDEGLRSFTAVEPARRASCIFEYVYFARPDSVIDGQSVYQARRDTGRILARENPVEADLVLGVPGGPRLRCRKRHRVHRRHREEPLRGPYLHPAHRRDASARHQAQAQSATRCDRGKAARRHRRLHRARQHLAQARGDVARCGSRRGALAHYESGGAVAVLLRHRHGHA